MNTPKPSESRAQREIVHGEWLAARNAEEVWGWDSPAGMLRARRRAQLIADGAEMTHGKYVLEIGCGTGRFTQAFAETGASILALDLSADLLNIARARNLPRDRVRFIEKPFEDCEIDGPFDAVIGSSVLHHLQIDVSLKRIHDLLRPRGVLSFAEPNMLNPQVFLERKLRFLPMFSYTSLDETAFVRSSFDRRLRAAGFTDVSIVPFDWLHPSTPPALIKSVLSLGRVLEKTPLLREFSGSLYVRAQRS